MQFHPEAQRCKPAFKDWSISLNGQSLSYEQVRPSLVRILRAGQVQEEIVDDLQLITEEVLVNVLKHGVSDQLMASIKLDLQLFESEVILDVVDNSYAWNPLETVVDPDLASDLADRPLGGLGLLLVNTLADHIDYHYDRGQNNLHIRKSLHKS